MDTVPCKYCDKETHCTGTRMCNLCYEVDRRIDQFARSTGGRERMLRACEDAVVRNRIAEFKD